VTLVFAVSLLASTFAEAKPKKKSYEVERPTAAVSVKVKGGMFGKSYRYTLHNQSAKPLTGFTLTVTSMKVSGCKAPEGWHGVATPFMGSTTIEWKAEGAGIRSKGDLSGFVLKSRSPAGTAPYVVHDEVLAETRGDTQGPVDSLKNVPKEAERSPIECK
jgi:hypothetical protein